MSEYKINRKNILGVDCILIEGPQGVGKTSFAFSIMGQDYKYHHKTRTRLATEFSNELNKKYGYNLHIDNRHLYFSNIKGYLDTKCRIKTWSCDLSRFALPNDNFAVDYFPPWSVIFFTEIDTQASCRNWQKFSVYYIYLFKYFRHMHYTIIMDAQIGEMIEKAVRKLSTKRFSVFESENKTSCILKRIKGRTTKFIAVNPQLLEFSRDMRRLEGSLSVGKAEKMKHHYKGNIFKQYDSFSAIPYFLYKIEDWTFNAHEDLDLSQEGIKKYIKLHPLELPKQPTKKKAS